MHLASSVSRLGIPAGYRTAHSIQIFPPSLLFKVYYKTIDNSTVQKESGALAGNDN